MRLILAYLICILGPRVQRIDLYEYNLYTRLEDRHSILDSFSNDSSEANQPHVQRTCSRGSFLLLLTPVQMERKDDALVRQLGIIS